ncbi:MAG: TonB-dependent receptor [Proteobacteria bacterium]|nr:TonB-dependent receptor [Pseudomonadota bacterium]
MTRRLRLVVALGLVGIVPPVAANAQPPPTVDVSDLPPLPAASEEQSTSATVLAATSAEEDVVVGAAKREQSLGNVASAVTVISSDRIRRFGYRTVGEAVAGVAGTYLEDNRIVATLGIRGMSILGDFNTRILVLVDGATVNEAWGAAAGIGFGSLVSIDEIARIEVIRGPVSSLYGTNAFFGIINIVTRGAAETPRAWGRAAINSVNGLASAAGFAAGGVHKQLKGSVFAMNRIGDATTLSELGGQPLESDGARAFAASIAGAWGGSFAQIRAFRFRRDSPWAPYDGAVDAKTPYSEYNTQLLVEAGHTEEVGKHLTIVGRAYGNFYRFSDHIDQYMAPNFDDIGDARTIGAELRGRYEILPSKLGVTAGTEANASITKSRAFETGDPGVTVDKNINSLKLLYAEGFRNPSAYEAFFHDDTAFAQPKDLRSETIRSFEAVVWAKPFSGLSTRVSGYYWDARGIVEQTNVVDPMFGPLLQFQNVGRYVTEGVEVEASYRNSAGWYAFGGGAYSRVGRAGAGEALAYGDVPNAPVFTAAGGVSTPRLGDLAHVSVDATVIGERPTRPDEDSNPLPTSPTWAGVNLTIFAPMVHGLDVTIGLRNLLGTRDLQPAPGDYDRTMSPDTVTVARIPGEGREVYAKVGYSY